MVTQKLDKNLMVMQPMNGLEDIDCTYSNYNRQVDGRKLVGMLEFLMVPKFLEDLEE